jgi:hypothetical protein
MTRKEDIKMMETTFSVTDFKNQVIEWTGTLTDALKRGYNIDCTHCYGCTGCIYCTGCNRCNRCSQCKECTGCENCSESDNCTDSCDCKCCFYCSLCIGVNESKFCYNIRNSSGCFYICSTRDCNGQPIQITTDEWIITIRQDKTTEIGCQNQPIHKWMEFTDSEIEKMHPKAIRFWRKWKPVIEAYLSTQQ